MKKLYNTFFLGYEMRYFALHYHYFTVTPLGMKVELKMFKLNFFLNENSLDFLFARNEQSFLLSS